MCVLSSCARQSVWHVLIFLLYATTRSGSADRAHWIRTDHIDFHCKSAFFPFILLPSGVRLQYVKPDAPARRVYQTAIFDRAWRNLYTDVTRSDLIFIFQTIASTYLYVITYNTIETQHTTSTYVLDYVKQNVSG